MRRIGPLASALAILAVASAAHAADLKKIGDLPILVDKYYEIKNPAGPVTKLSKGKFAALAEGPEMKFVPQFDPKGGIPMPDPRGQFGQ